MRIVVADVHPGSIGEALGIRPGDRILAVNGRDNLEDLLDYQFETTDSDFVEIHVQHTDGLEELFEIEKDPDELLGLAFESPIFTPLKTCNNACPFCFIDQQPEGLRASLYVKDDDYRLSYFNNTYITLTNLTDHDRKRIERLRPGPLYVSVHSTVPAIRRQLLANAKAGDILEKLQWLKGLGIPFHAQIVLCPGVNDGESLKQTLHDLAGLRPEALSVAIVPVGLTAHRDQLPSLTAVSPETANEVIQTVSGFMETRPDCSQFIFLSDEFYYRAGLPLPAYDAYGDFPQLDDGVGGARSLQTSFRALEAVLPEVYPGLNPEAGEAARFLLLTSALGAQALQPIANRLNTIRGLFVDIVSVEARFWGGGVSVAGLVTGQDIVHALRDVDLSGYRCALAPGVMLKPDSERFLDDMRLSDLSKTLALPITVIRNTTEAQELLEALFTTPRVL